MSYSTSRLCSDNIPMLYEHRDEIFKEDSFNFNGLEDIDSSGIAFLVQWAKSKDNQKLELINTSAKAKSLIQTFRLEPLFIIH